MTYHRLRWSVVLVRLKRKIGTVSRSRRQDCTMGPKTDKDRFPVGHVYDQPC